MGVPAHDQRDFDFAKKYDLEIIKVISNTDTDSEVYTGHGKLINSKIFNDLESKDAAKDIIRYISEKRFR